MHVSELITKLQLNAEEIMAQPDINERLEKALGKPMVTSLDEETAVMKVMFEAMGEMVKGAIEGEKLYTLKSKMLSADMMGGILNNNSGIEMEKIAHLVQVAPKAIEFTMTGIFTPDKGFYGRMEYEAAFNEFLKPLINSIAASHTNDEESRQGAIAFLENLLGAQHVFQPPSTLDNLISAAAIKEIALYDSEGVLITDTFEGFNKFLDSRALIATAQAKDELLGKINNMNTTSSVNPGHKPTI